MFDRKLGVAIWSLGFWGLASMLSAQDYSTPGPQPPPDSRPVRPFGGFFEDLGHSIFGGNETVVRDERVVPPSQTVQKYDSYGHPVNTLPPPRMVGVRTVPGPAGNATDLPDEPPASFGAQDGSPMPPPPGSRSAPAVVRRGTGENHNFQFDESPMPKPGAPVSAAPSEQGRDSIAVEPASSGGSSSAMPPLHERLRGFQQSAFGDIHASSPKTGADGPLDPSVAAQGSPAAGPSRTEISAENSMQEPVLTPPRPANGISIAPATVEPREEPARTADSVVAEKREPPAEPKWATGPKLANEAATDSNVLIAHKNPVLSVETLGPRKVVVGKEAAYEVTVQNSGEVAADEVTVFVGLPEWAEVAGAVASVGEARPAPQGHNEPLQWVVGHVEAKAHEKLVLKIIVRQSRPFELAVRWDYKPASSQATIEVQEAKLTMKLDGPREVFFGKREVYKLKLSNTGNGPAENLAITLMPLSAGEGQPVSHKLGTLAAGEQRTIEVELTARQAGNLTIQVDAHGDGSAHAELAEKILVRRAGLQVDMEGPTVQYVGTSATYRVRVRNPGDAAAKSVQLAINLPTGVKFSSGTDGVKLAPNNTKAQWTVDKLDPGGERMFFLKCTLALSGSNRLEAVTTAEEDLTASAEAVTQVEAMADLRLEVKDPEGPVPLGDEAAYELRIRNRGTKTAEHVEVVAYFSNGIEPTAAEGCANRLGPGQVVFDPIAAIPPAAEVVLRIRARAETVGNHVFRAEVHCKVLGTRLVREETTHFYQEGPASPQQAPQQALQSSEGGAGPDSVRTADRRALPPATLPVGPPPSATTIRPQ